MHGLPLMGTGDWNDGMDRVGEGGKGESVWLGWFLHATLVTFAQLAEQRGESARAHDWREHATALKDALELHGWDGDWYRRAYFDDGTPLGSVSNNECRINSIAQSWSVISGAAGTGPGGARHGGSRQISGAARRSVGAALYASLRSRRTRSRLY